MNKIEELKKMIDSAKWNIEYTSKELEKYKFQLSLYEESLAKELEKELTNK